MLNSKAVPTDNRMTVDNKGNIIYIGKSTTEYYGPIVSPFKREKK